MSASGLQNYIEHFSDCINRSSTVITNIVGCAESSAVCLCSKTFLFFRQNATKQYYLFFWYVARSYTEGIITVKAN